jgi:hypothetical protein
MKRYVVVPPVPGGYAFWNVADTRSSEYFTEDNFAVATISVHVPNAEQLARELCDRLNA